MPQVIKNRRLGKASATANVIVGKDIRVWEGSRAQGPFTIKQDIYLNTAMDWSVVHRYGVLLHEICHHLYPAKYPGGGAHQLANLIDDSRIERQGIAKREYFREALTALAIGVIANNEYDKDNGDRWTAEKFDPSTWALLFFRTYLPQEVQDAANLAIQAYNANKENGVDPDKFKELCDLGLRITRLKKVSSKTLLAFANLYVETFPKATENPNQQAGGMLSDESQGNGKKDEEGEGDEKQDAQASAAASGGEQSDGGDEQSEDQEGSSGGSGDEQSEDQEGDDQEGGSGGDQDEDQGEDQEGDDQDDQEGNGSGSDDQEGDENSDALQEALDALRDTLEVAHEVAAKQSEERAQEGVKESNIECGEGDGDGDNDDDGNGIGRSGNDVISLHRGRSIVDKGFLVRFKRMVRKLRCIAIDRDQGAAKSGRINHRKVRAADRLGILPRKPFDKKVQLEKDIPVAVAVCTDFSGSTGGLNARLNQFAHNATYAVQEAGCECSEVSWECSYSIIKNLEERVSPLKHHQTHSGGGTNLMAAAEGAIKSLRGAVATRKVAFIFTDGCVSRDEIKPLGQELHDNGFERAILVSLGSKVKPHGIVDTFTASSLSDVTTIFEGWVRKQVVRAEGLA